jgi:SAM-dependent methyltransferase
VSSAGDYDRIGFGYAAGRRADPRWERAIHAAIGPQARVLNVGAGTGSYEPSAQTVLAVEPSAVMIGQRPRGAAPVVRGVAEALPVRTGSVDVALAVLTVHHWQDWRAGVAELRRVAARRVVLSFDPVVHGQFWLIADYIPATAETDMRRTPPVAELAEALGSATVTPLLVPADCTDGVLQAHWRRPHAYLDPMVRQRASGLAQTDPAEVERGIARLAADLRSGSWSARYGHLLDRHEHDGGFRLIIAE